MPENILLATAYMPPVAYMALVAQAQNVTIEVCETYPKQTYRNRCTLLTAGGLLDLTVPVIRTNGNHTMTADIGVSYAEAWNVRHWRAIESAYSAAPYFLYYRDKLQQLLFARYERLIDLNSALLDYIMHSMKIESAITRSTDFVPPTADADDYRYCITPKRTLPAEWFDNYCQVFYTKFPFQHNLSSLDLLFNLGPESASYLKRTSTRIEQLQ